MANLLKVFLKQLFGSKYEGIKKSILVSVIIFSAIYMAEFKMTIAASVLYLTSTVFTMGVMWQGLNSAKNAEIMQGIICLPFENRQLMFSYVIAMSMYTVLGKTAVVLMLFFGLGSFSVPEVCLAILCACNSCLLTATAYVLKRKAGMVVVLLGMLGIVAAFFGVTDIRVLAGLILFSICITVVYLSGRDAYALYQPIRARRVLQKQVKRGSIWVYLLRYLLSNKSYLVNTAGLCAIACFLPFMLKELGGGSAIPIGFAILSLNTPICILLSVDPDLEQAVKMLPGQGLRFCVKYGAFIALVNLLVSSVYLCSCRLQMGNISGVLVLAAIAFAVQSAACSVLLEWFYPLRNWKIESDLYHHPRKYIVPAMMLLLAGLVSMWLPFVWIMLGMLLVELVIVAVAGFVAGRSL